MSIPGSIRNSDPYSDEELATAWELGMSVEELRNVLDTYLSYYAMFSEIRRNKRKMEGK